MDLGGDDTCSISGKRSFHTNENPKQGTITKHLRVGNASKNVGNPSLSGDPGKSEIARHRLRQPSTNQIAALTRATPAIYPSYLPDGRNHPAYITHRTRTRTYKNAQNPAAHATIDVRSRHRTNPRSTRFVLDKASECRRRPQSGHMDSLSRRREVAHGVLRSWPKPEQTFFSPKQGSRFLVVCFLHTSRRYTFDLDME